jgi:hypothetical protein
MGKMKEQLIDIEEQLANGATPQEVSDFTGLPVSEILRIEAYALGDVDVSFNDEDYENHRRFQMIVDSLMNPPSFTGVENS